MCDGGKQWSREKLAGLEISEGDRIGCCRDGQLEPSDASNGGGIGCGRDGKLESSDEEDSEELS